jgi:hypothetical protein
MKRLSKSTKVAGEIKASTSKKRNLTTHATKDLVRSSPKTTHRKSTHDPGKNLGKYLHAAKLPTGSKIGATVKRPRKLKIKSI